MFRLWRDSLRLLKGSENFDSKSASGSVRAVDGVECLRRVGMEEVEVTGEGGEEDEVAVDEWESVGVGVEVGEAESDVWTGGGGV